jgi:hypothetical protein
MWGKIKDAFENIKVNKSQLKVGKRQFFIKNPKNRNVKKTINIYEEHSKHQ